MEVFCLSPSSSSSSSKTSAATSPTRPNARTPEAQIDIVPFSAKISHVIFAFLNTCPSSCRPPLPFVPYRKLLRAMDIFKYDPGACGGCDLSPVSILLFHFKSISSLFLGVEERNRRDGCMRGRWGRRRQRPRWRTHACTIFTI